MLVGLSLVLVLGWRQVGAVIRDPVELFPFPSCPWAAVGTWICPLQPVPFPPCSALESLEAFSKRRKPSNRSETPWGAQHHPISPGRTTGAVTSCSVSSASPGQVFLGWNLQISTALNPSHFHKGAVQVFPPLLIQFLHLYLF